MDVVICNFQRIAQQKNTCAEGSRGHLNNPHAHCSLPRLDLEWPCVSQVKEVCSGRLDFQLLVGLGTLTTVNNSQFLRRVVPWGEETTGGRNQNDLALLQQLLGWEEHLSMARRLVTLVYHHPWAFLDVKSTSQDQIGRGERDCHSLFLHCSACETRF